MTIYFFTGKPRTGKTLHVVMNLWSDYLNQREITIVEQPELRFPEMQNRVKPNIISVNDFLAIQNLEVTRTPKSIGIQEFTKLFDARRSGRKENVMLSSITGQSGKRNVDIYYDDQFPSRVDKGMRDVTDKTFLCDCFPSPETKQEPIAFTYTEFEGFLLYPTGKYHIIPAIYMQQFYSLYDTYKPTRSLESRDKQK